jgi:hypothetical protein
MADITMCEGRNCPLKEKCYRHTAFENPFRQSYFSTEPYDDKKENCEYFWEDTEYRKAFMTKHSEEPS